MSSLRRGSTLLRCAAAALLLCTSGCSRLGSASSTRMIRSAGTDATEAHLTTVRRMIDRLVQRIQEHRLSQLDILLLSSGGQFCAYAAGFLRGWQEHTQPGSLPAFDLVTGVSSSALLAPFALLGTPEALAQGGGLYRSNAIAEAPVAGLWFERRRAAGLPEASNYEKVVARAIDARLQTSLEAELQKKRQIVIATTDFDVGAMRFWDFGHELGRDAKGRHRARALLMASAAVPGVYAPVMIDRHLHAAGDVFGALVNPLTFEDYRTLTARMRAIGLTEGIRVNVWVILSGFVKALPEEVDPGNRSDVAARSNTLMFLAAQAREIDRLAHLTDAVNAGIRGMHMELRVTRIPDALAVEPGAFDAYSESFSMHLEQVGYERGRSNDPWDLTVVPRPRTYD